MSNPRDVIFDSASDAHGFYKRTNAGGTEIAEFPKPIGGTWHAPVGTRWLVRTWSGVAGRRLLILVEAPAFDVAR